MIHIIVGNTGAGKTTYATNLKSEINGILFSIDKWNRELFLQDKREDDGLQWFLERIERSEVIIMDLITQLEGSGTDSILDLGFSKFEHREKFRRFAVDRNVNFKIHFLDIPGHVRLQRIQYRNKEKGATFEFEVSQKDFDFMEDWFETPTDQEMQSGIRIN